MPEFVLDKSGEVSPGRRFEDLDDFTQGYIESLFFTEHASNAPSVEDFLKGCEPGTNEGSIHGNAGFADLAPETLARIIADCEAFIASPTYQALIQSDEDIGEAEAQQAGSDFWYTRNGHGCGFWDGGWPEPYATELTNAAKSFGEISPYLGDDGKVYF